MDDPFKQLPRAAAIVYVGVLAAGSGRVARAEQPEAPPSDAVALQPDQHNVQIAPTCGPQCHRGSDEVTPVVLPPDPEPELEQAKEIAPTCGPQCHDPSWDNPLIEPPIEPPPIPVEERKQGCAVESADVDEPGLALLGLGLLAGVTARRRRESR